MKEESTKQYQRVQTLLLHICDDIKELSNAINRLVVDIIKESKDDEGNKV